GHAAQGRAGQRPRRHRRPGGLGRRAPLAGAAGGHRRPDLRRPREAAGSGRRGGRGRLNASVWVSPKAGRELRDAAIKAVLYSIVFIMIFVAFRFDLRFAPGGILALTHDALVTLG
ncbi:MAG: hypothetical protein ACK55I_11520, partial [bacterium]